MRLLQFVGCQPGLPEQLAQVQAEHAGAGFGPREDEDLRILPAPTQIPDCITWAVVPRGRVLREYALALLHGVAPQLDRRDLRRVLEGNQEADWPTPPSWQALSQSISL